MQIDLRLAEIDDCLYRLAVRALIFHEGKVLLVREKDADWWAFPGGGIDHGENVSQAFPRELAEELGVSAAELDTDYRIIHVAVGAIVNGVPRANLFYRVEVPVDRLRAGDDVSEIGWFAPAELTPEIIARYAGPSDSDAAELVKAIELQASK